MSVLGVAERVHCISERGRDAKTVSHGRRLAHTE